MDWVFSLGIELAISGSAALEALCASGAMERLLPLTRIWARTKPDDKTNIINRHIGRALIVSMAGDGGNDCGALRTAHAGLALSEAEASVVSPFTSKSGSIRSVVDVLCEGRGALATAFGSFKFLLMYGLFFSVLKLASFYFGVILCNTLYLLIDILTVIGLTGTMPLSLPLPDLADARPPASLLGKRTLLSLASAFLINFIFFCIQMAVMSHDPEYVPWPSELAAGGDWWTLGDNWECTTLFASIYLPFIACAVAFTLGGQFRRPLLSNVPFSLVALSLYILATLLLVLPSSDFTRTFHIASEQFNSPCPPPCYEPYGNQTVEPTTFDYSPPCNTCPINPVWLKYQQPPPGGPGGRPSAPMSPASRLRLWGLATGSCAVIVLWEAMVIPHLAASLRRLGAVRPRVPRPFRP